MKTLLEIVNRSVEFLQKKGIHNPRHEAQFLISDLLKIRPLDLYMQYDRPLNDSELELCRQAIQRRGQGEPSQYIRGEVEFYHCSFQVNRDVLIPRQETEILVDMAAKQIEKDGVIGKTLWDVCCGSGCIGIALKKKFPALHVVLSDLSEKALDVARNNAKRNDVEVEFRHGDFLTPFENEKTDYLLCNPPYVSEEEFGDLDVEVRDYEPKMALAAGEQGLAFYRRLAKEISLVLNAEAKVWLEIGHQQGEAVSEIFKGIKSRKAEIKQDWSGKDRFFFLEIE